MGDAAMRPDPENQGGSGVGQRLVPLSIILNSYLVRRSPSVLTGLFPLSLSSKASSFNQLANNRYIYYNFPFRVFLFDYVRVNQRGPRCDSHDFPTA